MVEQSVEAGASPESVPPMGEAEIEELVDFWRGNRVHFSRIIDNGLDFIGKLSSAAQAPFLGYMANPPDLISLVADATEIVSQIPVDRCKEYNLWLQSHPGEIVVRMDGVTHQVTEVVVSGHDIFPVVKGEVTKTKLNAHWLDSKDNQ